MTTLTYTEAKNLLLKAVQEQGADYIYGEPYGTCRYFEPDNQPSCIVGHILHYKGITGDELKDNDSNEMSLVDLAAYFDGIDIEDRAVIVLNIAQRLQDLQVPWGRAVAIAITAIEDEGNQVDVDETVRSYLEHAMNE